MPNMANIRAKLFSCFFVNDTATTEIYTLSLHDALPISAAYRRRSGNSRHTIVTGCASLTCLRRSEEHTSEFQSRVDLVCRLLLAKKKATNPSSVSSAKTPRRSDGPSNRHT